ncbi:MAG: NAD(P)H-dependent oxidoreductase [Thiohalorhabdus sp.]|uniref:NAD(P)H-dependent oxidoreductase n=1 Tax=Thiohalorhabdus sp. TaxID=3094134 RepID=UPI0039801E7C
MSRILIIYGHPSPESFNAAVTEAAQEAIREAGGDFVVHDPYGDGLDPVLSFRKSLDPHTKRYVRELQEATGYIVVHPDWWGQPPAMLKGYLDLVFQEGVAYQRSKGGGWPPEGLLRGNAALVLNTADGPWQGEPANDPLEAIWRDRVFGPCGVESVQRRVFAPVSGSTPEQREGWLDEVRVLVGGYVRENGLVGAAT